MRGMKALLTGILGLAAVGLPSLAVAEGPRILHADWSVRIGETPILEQILDPDQATPLSNGEMAEERGGIRGMSFSVHFDGIVNGTSGEGVLHLIGPDGVITTDGVPDPGANSGVDVQSFIGDMGPFQGLGQWAVVNGDGNDVSNSLTVNIFVTDDTGSMTTFTDVLSSIDVTGP